MARRRNPLLQWALTTSALAFLRLTALLPLPLCRALGRGLGRLAYWLVPRIRRVGLANLDLAYGDSLTASEKKRILGEASENLGVVAAEFSRLPIVGRQKAGNLFRVEGVEHVDLDRGGLLISAHLGNWEWMAAAAQSKGMRLSAVVRPLDDPRLNRVVDGLRRAGKMDTLPKAAAGPEVIRLIREGKFVGILVDQSARENGVPAEFFGQPCWATVAPAMVALRTKAPVYPLSMIRNPDGSYALEIRPPIEFERTADFREDLVRVTQQCQDAIEVQVRRRPEQWLWMHRRWKERPRLQAEWNERSNGARSKSAK